jgi:16S rRNA (adenine1518-N6/adenine1519-N6)-dimethyltransferase
MGTLLIDHPTCTGQFVTIQREVADRLLAEPGRKAYGPLGVIVQALADVWRIGTVKPTSFRPQPKVTSAMVAISSRRAGRPEDATDFARFVTELFSQRRKQLGSILGRDRDWPEGVTDDLRPEVLTIGQLIELWRSATPS